MTPKLIERYTARVRRVKHLPAQLNDLYAEHGLLLTHDYPVERLSERRQLTASMWKAMACPQALRFKQWDRLIPAAKKMPLMTGTMFHNMVGLLFAGDIPPERSIVRTELRRWVEKNTEAYRILEYRRAAPNWKAATDRNVTGIDALHLEAEMLEAMIERWLNDPPELEPLAIGVRGRVPIPHPTTGRRDPIWDYAFEFDGLCRHRSTGALWVWELKSAALTTRDEYERSIDHDPQRWGYPGGMGRLMRLPDMVRIPEVGICYDVVGKHVPAAPGYLVCKKGPCGKKRKEIGAVAGVPECEDCKGSGIIGISKAAVVSTFALVEGAIGHLAKVSPKGREAVEKGEYNEMLGKARKDEERLAFRIWSKPNREQQEAFWSEAYRIAHEIQRYARAHANGKDIWPRQRRMCRILGGCSYVPICPGDAWDRYNRAPGEQGAPIEYAAPLEPANLPDRNPGRPNTPSGDPDIPF